MNEFIVALDKREEVDDLIGFMSDPATKHFIKAKIEGDPLDSGLLVMETDMQASDLVSALAKYQFLVSYVEPNHIINLETIEDSFKDIETSPDEWDEYAMRRGVAPPVIPPEGSAPEDTVAVAVLIAAAVYFATRK